MYFRKRTFVALRVNHHSDDFSGDQNVPNEQKMFLNEKRYDQILGAKCNLVWQSHKSIFNAMCVAVS